VITKFSSLAILLTLLTATPRVLQADWTSVTSLDQPVIKLSSDQKKARDAMKARFEAQIAANEAFLRDFPDDPHAYDSRVRLAVAEARLGSLEQDPRVVDAALGKLMALEKKAPDESQRAEAMFRRISLQWQNLGSDPDQRRDRAVTSSKSFANLFPEDRRSPRLLAEAASLCDNHPELKRPLVERALELSKEESLTQRLRDDLKRLDQLGKPVDLSFTDMQGDPVSLPKERGNVVALVFWAADSFPSLLWMRDFTSYVATVPSLKVIGVSLDQERNDLLGAMKALKINWPTAFDGKGWQNSVARQCGINSVPTLWLIDRQGRLRYLNARDNYQLIISELMNNH